MDKLGRWFGSQKNCTLFNLDELSEALVKMKLNRAPGLHDLPIKVLKRLWLMVMEFVQKLFNMS